MPSAPLAISSQSRKKLKSFHFETKNAPPRENKENHDGFVITVPDDSEDAVQGRSPRDDDARPHRFPSTPAAKIPLTDLIGNTEDAFNYAPAAATPNDHVIWQHGPRSSDPSSSLHSTQRGKKRARSSSPSSWQYEVSNHFSAPKEALNLEDIHKSLRTPQNDPAVELWNRYANGNMSKTDTDSALPSIVCLRRSSPETPSTTNSKELSLRRTASCGIQWPTSNAKRRRVDNGESHGRARDIFAASKKEILGLELPRASRVSILVEKIHESLSKRPVAEADGPSSSSPLPERHVTDFAISPLRAPARMVPVTSVSKDDVTSKTNIQPTSESARVSSVKCESDGSSEFADDDIDLDFIEGVEFAATQFEEQQKGPETVGSAPERALPAEGAQCLPHLRPADTVSGVITSKVPLQAGYVLDDDEFDDDFGTDEILLTEMDGLVAQYECPDERSLTHELVKPVPQRPPSMVSQSIRQPEVDVVQLDDEFDGGDDEIWKDIGDSQIMPDHLLHVGSTKQKTLDNRAIKRYLILDVVGSTYHNEHGRTRPEKMLSVKDEKTKMLKIVLLRQSWYDTRCTKGSYIHLVGEFDHTGQCVVDDTDNMVILHPDHLISATVVADSFTCTRRAALQDRVKATSAAEKSQVYGHILHEIFGQALRANEWQDEELRKIVTTILPSYLESLYEINVQVPEAIDYLMGKMPALQAWAAIYVSASPAPDAVVQDRNGALATMSINKLLETEEHVWSPMYGLKGNIDATIQVAMQLPGQRQSNTLTVPLEFKTGKKDNNESHRAQTALYTLLLSDRYDVNVTCGVLYYLETSKTFRVEGVRNEIRQMIIQRNELACYVHDKLDLPPMIQKEHMCRRCYAQTSCFTYHKLVEDGDGETSGMTEVFDDAVKHLNSVHQEFFKKWDTLLTKEEVDTMKFRRELWTMLSTEREGLGRCFASVIIEPGSAQENQQGSKINRFQYAFVKHKSSPGFSFAESQLTIGEPIVISDEQGHFALANGFVTSVRPHRIAVAVDRRLHDVRRKGRNFHPVTNQVFKGVMEVRVNGAPSQFVSLDEDEPQLFRLDKDEFSNGMATARNNIVRLMEKNLFRARELRQLIIEDCPPSFKPSSSAYTLGGPASQADLNIDQEKAIEKVMSAKDYALVLGMPGTGKTTTIAHIIRALISQNKSVLLTSYTHTAVDNILLKIKDDNIPILRLGAVGKVHPEVQNFADLAGMPKKTIAELENSYVNSKVVASTCLAVNHPIFNARIFDYCIVDEASQITLPVCLGPIRMVRTFILVGDHFQLPPLVQNKEAQEGGLDVSLFKQLSDAHPEAVVNLEHQYRMAEDIQLLANTLIYHGRLKCGTPAVAARALNIPDLDAGLAAHHHTSAGLSPNLSKQTKTICLPSSTSTCWLRRALTPTSRVVFLNTDPLLPFSKEISHAHGTRITNPTESLLTAQLITTLIHSGVSPRSIGVITFYRSQLALLKSDIRAITGTVAAGEVEVHTADKFQGRDKEVTILSCVRSNKSCQIGELLKDWRRVNVAITRAKSKLLIIGSRETLGSSGNEVLEGLINVVDGKRWVLDLPIGAVEMHSFGDGSAYTQTQKKDMAVDEEASSPSKKKMKDVFRVPGKVVKGGVDVERLLDGGKRPVMRDIVNAI